MPADREERHIRAWIDGLRRAVAGDMPRADLARFASAAMGDEEAEVGEPIAMGDPTEVKPDSPLELTHR
jgi:hypothetical protein